MTVSAALHAVYVVCGAMLVLLVLVDVFQAVILPRATGIHFRISARISRSLWPLWSSAAMRMNDNDMRENFLGAFGPLALVLFLLVWGFGCIVGYGLIFYGLGHAVKPEPNFGDATYFAGTAFLTLGFGDFVATSASTRFVALLAAGSGFSIVAVVTAFLFSLFGSFATRENFVVTFGTRAGSPPSGVTLLETYAKLDIFDDLDDVFEEGMRWSAAVLESHLAYPILVYFRSSHDYESWVAALGALLDAATLRITLIAGGNIGHAKLFSGMGEHCVRDLASFFSFEDERVPGVERAEFDTARERLIAAGLEVNDGDDAWEKFVTTRTRYASILNDMARYFRIPPALWIGDRSMLRNHGR